MTAKEYYELTVAMDERVFAFHVYMGLGNSWDGFDHEAIMELTDALRRSIEETPEFFEDGLPLPLIVEYVGAPEWNCRYVVGLTPEEYSPEYQQIAAQSKHQVVHFVDDSLYFLDLALRELVHEIMRVAAADVIDLVVELEVQGISDDDDAAVARVMFMQGHRTCIYCRGRSTACKYTQLLRSYWEIAAQQVLDLADEQGCQLDNIRGIARIMFKLGLRISPLALEDFGYDYQKQLNILWWRHDRKHSTRSTGLKAHQSPPMSAETQGMIEVMKEGMMRGTHPADVEGVAQIMFYMGLRTSVLDSLTGMDYQSALDKLWRERDKAQPVNPT